MPPRPRRATAYLGTGNGVTSTFNAQFGSGRRVIANSVVFRVYDHSGKVFYEGHPDRQGKIFWREVGPGTPTNTEGSYNSTTRQVTITFDSALPMGYELRVDYQWQPHFLIDSKLKMLVDGEERWVPIRDLQQALNTDLREEE